jgi:crotonobetainyl-CoA:carnitine CoA-transferase CaiB-like acyl-CoA transferase
MAEIPYTDYTSGEHTVFAVMAALMHRLRTGQGQFIDISQTQATSSTMPEVLMDYSANGRAGQRMGNQDTTMSPHGCYPCRGDDRWITIAVATDRQWRSLCWVLGQEGWAADSRFEDSLGRWQNRDELDALMGPVTKDWDTHELMHALQREGVAAGAVLDSKDLLFDPHLNEREFYEVVTHHESTGIPPLPYAGRPWKLSKTPAVKGKAAPLMGEHNSLILEELLGKTAEEMATLEEAGIIGYGPTNPHPVQRPPLDEQVRQGRMQRYETDFEEQVRKAFPG